MANPLRNAVGRLRGGVDPRSVAIGALLDAVLERVYGEGDAPAPGSPEIRAEDSFRAGAADYEAAHAAQDLLEDRLDALAFAEDDELVHLGHHHHHHPHHHGCGCGDC